VSCIVAVPIYRHFVVFYLWFIIYIFKFYNQKCCLGFTKVSVQFYSFPNLLAWTIKSETDPRRSSHFQLPAETAYTTYLPLPSVLWGNLPYPQSKYLLCRSDKEITFENMYEFREIIFLNVYWLQLDLITVIKWSL
jgi:hypothetical protein